MKVGFTGTQAGMTEGQVQQLANALLWLKCQEFHHGDCIGADKMAHFTIRRSGIYKVGHPPLITSKRAYCLFDKELPPKPYLERNHDIVDATEVLIACPKLKREELRSGTWATVRYARKVGKPVIILWP